MSKEQNLSPPPTPPVDNSRSKLPPLPEDFLSFQSQPSFTYDHIDNSIANNSLANDSPYDIEQIQQQQGTYGPKWETYHGGYSGMNNKLAGGDGGGEGYYSNYGDGNYKEYIGTYGTPKSGYKRGSNNYSNYMSPNFRNDYKRGESNDYRSNDYKRGISTNYRRLNDYNRGGSNDYRRGGSNDYKRGGSNAYKRGGFNNHNNYNNYNNYNYKKRRFDDTNNKNNTNVDISLYYKKSFLSDPWADLI